MQVGGIPARGEGGGREGYLLLGPGRALGLLMADAGGG